MSSSNLFMRTLRLQQQPRLQQVRTFRTARPLWASKETAPADETRKAEIENTKQEQLREQKEGRNEWKDGLASESESVVKADRGELKANKETIGELQKESAKAAQRERDGK
ncbi:hypothetical protein M409DRAFT_24864 [Zasmidium cellare ATCC 36951]|uniref:Uncharacterized protein n=1 Tax=Zasmidium cellare ATCC 36951 TaxID=1080233 RepID=A0A6A6CE43_ZASCE|nr:uncharacterized protein M409DRAFT_24864 [Zasmidium cellare ATCC 36951]KAF2164963.1 hypothetical protein M409DRAFT_24864 [Zasmidium cellare ATCC 36951]